MVLNGIKKIRNNFRLNNTLVNFKQIFSATQRKLIFIRPRLFMYSFDQNKFVGDSFLKMYERNTMTCIHFCFTSIPIKDCHEVSQHYSYIHLYDQVFIMCCRGYSIWHIYSKRVLKSRHISGENWESQDSSKHRNLRFFTNCIPGIYFLEKKTNELNPFSFYSCMYNYTYVSFFQIL